MGRPSNLRRPETAAASTASLGSDAVVIDRPHVAFWHVASFRCAAEFGRDRGIADIEQAAAIKLL